MKWTDKIRVTNEDNMALMSRYPDDYFELAIVDPPYGKKPTRDNKGKVGFNASKNYDNKADIWDIRPAPEYFKELFRTSKNQIIWGANYLIEDLYSSNGWVCWDKKNGDNIFADFELAYTSFNSRARIYRKQWIGANANNGTPRIHPTEKPVALYKWLLMNYAKENDKILDTHLGSGSIALACHELGFSLTACELDLEYYEAAHKRFKEQTAQLRLKL